MFTLDVDKDIKLALVQPSFAARYVELRKQNYAYLAQWLAWPLFCDSEEKFKGFVKKSLTDYAEGKSMVCAIVYKGEIVGNASFNTINRELSKVDIGYWLASRYQGKGIVTRVVLKLVDIAFNELGLEKIEIQAATGNSGSRAVCERLGMTLEGVITRNEVIDGRVLDHAVYGLTKGQYQHRH